MKSILLATMMIFSSFIFAQIEPTIYPTVSNDKTLKYMLPLTEPKFTYKFPRQNSGESGSIILTFKYRSCGTKNVIRVYKRTNKKTKITKAKIFADAGDCRGPVELRTYSLKFSSDAQKHSYIKLENLINPSDPRFVPAGNFPITE